MVSTPTVYSRARRRSDHYPEIFTTISRLIRASLFLLSLAAPGARGESLPLWEVGVGAAAISFPDYRGSDERQTWLLPFPYIVYRGEFLQADERRVRGLFFKTPRLELDVSVNGTVPVDSGDNNARRGMPDLDATLEIGPSLNVLLTQSDDRKTRLELRLPVRAAFASDFSYVRQVGWIFQPNLNLDVADPLGYAGWNLGLLAGPLFTDKRYNQYFYGVEAPYATANRPAYSPGGGYAGTQFVAALSRRYREYWAGAFLKWDTLGGAAFADSPLLTDRRSFAAGFAVARVLGESKTRVEAAR